MGVLAGVGDFGVSDILNQAIIVKSEIEEIANRTPKGYFNPTLNSTIQGPLTNAPDPDYINGTFYEVDVPGLSPISGANFSAGDALKKGDRIVKIDSHWVLKPNPETEYLQGDISDLQKETKVISHIRNEIIESFANNNGDINTTKVIVVPNTVSGNETGFRFKVKPESSWKPGDVLYLEAVVTENIPNITTYSGQQQLKFNLNVKRGSSTVSDAAASTQYSRISATKVLLSFTYVVNSADTELAYVIQKPAGSSLNNSGSAWVWTINEINQRLTKLNETLPPIAAELHNLSLGIAKNTDDLTSSHLAYLANNVVIYSEPNNGGVFSANTLTIPVGQHGANSIIGLRVEIASSPYYSKMAGKRVSFEYIANVSADLITKRTFSCQAYVRINGELFPGKSLDLKVTSIDSEHIKVSFDVVIEPNLTQIVTFLEFYDNAVVTGSAQKIELTNKFHFYWLDPGQKNINTAVFEGVLDNVLSAASSFAGQSIVWCGTSIPWYYQPNSYPELVARRLGATVYNTAIGGSKIIFDGGSYGMSGTIAELVALHPSFAEHSYENTIMKYLVDPYNCKDVFIDHSFNDVEQLFPGSLGTIDSTNKANFYGAFDFVIKEILNNHPDVRIRLITCPNKYPEGNAVKAVQHESARTAVKAIASKWGLAISDLGGLMGFNQITAVAGKKTFDGIHQTQAETEEIAKVLYRFMLNIS